MVNVSLDRPFSSRLITWRNSDTSNEILLEPGAAWNLYIPSGFTGTQVTILTHVERDTKGLPPALKTTDEEIIDGYKVYSNGVVAIATADQVYDLTDNQLFGLSKIKLQSDQTETCTGELFVSS